MFTSGTCRRFIFLVNLLRISILREKYAKLLSKISIKDNIYCEGIVNIPMSFKMWLACTSGINSQYCPHISLLPKKTLLLSIKLPQKIIPYIIAE